MFKKAFAIFATGSILLICIWLTASAQNYDNEILTMFIRGTVDFPEGETIAEISEIKFTPSDIGDTISSYGGVTMSPAFPDYKREDSIFVSPNDPNLRVKQIELDLIYKIYLDEPELRNALNSELEQFDEVLFSQNNGTVQPLVNDPRFGEQWALDNTNDYISTRPRPGNWKPEVLICQSA